MRAGGYQHDLESRMEEFDAMPLAKVDGQGLGGSVIPWHMALLAIDSWHSKQAQAQLQRADPQMGATQLLTAASDLHAGRTVKAIKTAESVRDSVPSLFFSVLSDAGSRLSARELEIVQHLARWLTRNAIARQLFISVNTLKSQLRSVYRKLEVSSAAAAVREAEYRGLL